MAVQLTTKANIVSKLALGKAHTSNSREHYNEIEVSSFLLSAENIFANVINSDPESIENANIVSALITLELEEISNQSGQPQAYKCKIGNSVPASLVAETNPKTGELYAVGDDVGFILDQRFGVDFEPILKDNGARIYPLDASDWVLDPYSGIITQETDNESEMFDLGTDGTLECYVYIGAFVSEVLSVSGSLAGLQDVQQQLNDLVVDEGKFKIDAADGVNGYFTDNIKAGSNVSFSEEISGNNKTLYINSTVEANGIFGEKEFSINDSTLRVDYDVPISGGGYPVISLTIPTSADFLQIAGIYNSNDNGFNVKLSGPTRSEGYKVNWMINASSQFDLGTIGQSIIPSQDIVYDLGKVDKRWRDLYLSGNTIYIGDENISITESISSNEPVITFSGKKLVSLDETGSIPLASLPAEITSGITFIDTIDPNTTFLPNVSAYNTGSYYIANNTGTLTDNISASFSVEEMNMAINNGTTWRLVPFKVSLASIGNAQIKTAGVHTDNILAGAITETKLANNSVTISKIANGVLNVGNFSTTETNINKVLRPDGSGGIEFGPINIDVGIIESDVNTLNTQVLDLQNDKLDTTTFAALSGQGDSNVDLSQIAMDIVPISANTFSLGTSAMPWKELYVSNSSIHIGDKILSASNGRLNIDGRGIEDLTIESSAGEYGDNLFQTIGGTVQLKASDDITDKVYQNNKAFVIDGVKATRNGAIVTDPLVGDYAYVEFASGQYKCGKAVITIVHHDFSIYTGIRSLEIVGRKGLNDFDTFPIYNASINNGAPLFISNGIGNNTQITSLDPERLFANGDEITVYFENTKEYSAYGIRVSELGISTRYYIGEMEFYETLVDTIPTPSSNVIRLFQDSTNGNVVTAINSDRKLFVLDEFIESMPSTFEELRTNYDATKNGKRSARIIGSTSENGIYYSDGISWTKIADSTGNIIELWDYKTGVVTGTTNRTIAPGVSKIRDETDSTDITINLGNLFQLTDGAKNNRNGAEVINLGDFPLLYYYEFNPSEVYPIGKVSFYMTVWDFNNPLGIKEFEIILKDLNGNLMPAPEILEVTSSLSTPFVIEDGSGTNTKVRAISGFFDNTDNVEVTFNNTATVLAAGIKIISTDTGGVFVGEIELYDGIAIESTINPIGSINKNHTLLSNISGDIDILQTQISNQQITTNALTTNTNINETHSFITCNASTGPFTCTLPSISGGNIDNGKYYDFKKIDSSNNVVWIDGNGVNIDGTTTYGLSAQYDGVSMINDGTQWWIRP